jgi:hypothetical protein
MSRRDGAIVAWHEVPGATPPQKDPSRRVRCDSCSVRASSRIGVIKISKTKTDFLVFKKHSAHFDEKIPHELVVPIIPYPTGRSFGGDAFQALRAWLLSCYPSGTKPFAAKPNPRQTQALGKCRRWQCRMGEVHPQSAGDARRPVRTEPLPTSLSVALSLGAVVLVVLVLDC